MVAARSSATICASSSAARSSSPALSPPGLVGAAGFAAGGRGGLAAALEGGTLAGSRAAALPLRHGSDGLLVSGGSDPATGRGWGRRAEGYAIARTGSGDGAAAGDRDAPAGPAAGFAVESPVSGPC